MKKRMKGCLVCAGMALSATAGFFAGHSMPIDLPAESMAVVHETQNDEIAAFRTERQQLRQMQISQLNEMIHAENPDPEIVSNAQKRQLELMDWSEKEVTLENILKIRGFRDAVVTVHTDSVNVILRADSITRQEAAVILELTAQETGISGGNVKIIPIN